jgi:hypothetical protein
MIRTFTQQTSVQDALQPEIDVLLDRISQQHMSACNVVIISRAAAMAPPRTKHKSRTRKNLAALSNTKNGL